MAGSGFTGAYLPTPVAIARRGTRGRDRVLAVGVVEPPG
jgi:hypothetical protein